MTAKGMGVIYLHRDRFEIYSPLPPRILEFNFVTDLVRDMEIINKDFLLNILKIFIQNNKLTPSNLIIVIANNACFVRDFNRDTSDKPPIEKTQEINSQIDEFLEHVPYEDVSGKTFDFQKGIRVFAVNQELFEVLKFAFEQEGFAVDSVLPAGVFSNDIQQLPALTLPAAAGIIQNSFMLKKYNFLNNPIQEHQVKQDAHDEPVEEVQVQEADQDNAPKPKNDHKREIMLGAVFGLLLVVLVIVYYVSNTPVQPGTNAQGPVSSVESINP